MATLTGTFFGQTLELLKTTLADSAYFQEWIGSPGDSAAALERIYKFSTLSDGPYPMAVISVQPGLSISSVASSGPTSFNPAARGTLDLILYQETPAEFISGSGQLRDEAGAVEDIWNKGETVLREIANMSGDGLGHLVISGFSYDRTGVSDPRDGDDFALTVVKYEIDL